MSWGGDQTVDWSRSDGLPSSIVSALSLASSGMGLTHSDIGGYTGEPLVGLVRTKVRAIGKQRNERFPQELFLRWAEYSAFTPVMRTHEVRLYINSNQLNGEIPSQGNHPAENHQFYTDSDTLDKFGKLTQIYTMLGRNINPRLIQF